MKKLKLKTKQSQKQHQKKSRSGSRRSEVEEVVEEVIVEEVVEVEAESSVDEGEVSILDGATPQATATEETNLPQTGGIPLEGLAFAGTVLIGLGRKLRKR
jgi:LPXTG-motif cell wall-anchored protein